MMKTSLLSSLTFLMMSAVCAQNVYIPDPVLKDFLVNHSWLNNPNNPSGGTWIYLDANHDGEIQVSEATPYLANYFDHGFNLNNLNITDMTGIEAFKSIEKLVINTCPITYLNIDGCTSLNILRCSGSSLPTFSMNHPSLEELDLSTSATITTISLTGFGLKTLRINNNPLLSTINFTIHQELTFFQCYNNALTTLDLSSCSSLANFYCTGNQLTSINLANGNMQSFQHILLTGYPELTCIQVDNSSVAEYLWGGGYPYEFDAWATFNTDCTPPGPCIVHIPDANFKAALLANTAINTDGNNEIECTEAIAYTSGINVDNILISDLTGIEAFVNITSFSSNNNQTMLGYPILLDTLDVSNFTSLTTISCTGNVGFVHLNASGCIALTQVDVSTWVPTGLSVNLSGCSSLTALNLSNKRLNALNVTNCTALTSLDCSSNLLTALDVSSCSALTTLNCANNQIINLNTLNNTNMTTLNCSHNQLPYLILALNTALTTIDCSHNALTYIDLNNNSNLTTLNCSHNSLNTISANNNPVLVTMDCSYNNLTVLHVNIDIALITLNCSYNQLTTLNVGNNPQLQVLRCDHNVLPSVDVSSNLALHTLSCMGNNLPTLDVSQNVNLRSLYCSDNQLNSLDLTANVLLLELICSYNQLTTLNLQQQAALVNLACTHNQLVDLDLSNTFVLLLACENNLLQSLNLANGHNTNAIMISANNNPDLTCIQVDDANYSLTNWTSSVFVFDAGVSFSEDCGLLTQLNEMDNTRFYLAYPNPTHGMIYFAEPSDLVLCNALGQMVCARQQSTSLDLSTYPAGVYFLSFVNDSGQTVQHTRVVKE